MAVEILDTVEAFRVAIVARTLMITTVRFRVFAGYDISAIMGNFYTLIGLTSTASDERMTSCNWGIDMVNWTGWSLDPRMILLRN